MNEIYWPLGHQTIPDLCDLKSIIIFCTNWLNIDPLPLLQVKKKSFENRMCSYKTTNLIRPATHKYRFHYFIITLHKWPRTLEVIELQSDGGTCFEIHNFVCWIRLIAPTASIGKKQLVWRRFANSIWFHFRWIFTGFAPMSWSSNSISQWNPYPCPWRLALSTYSCCTQRTSCN